MKRLSLVLVTLLLVLTAFINTNQKERDFQDFLAGIDSIALPYDITIEDLGPTAKEKANHRDRDWSRDHFSKMNRFREFIPELKSGRFSRMGPPIVELLAKIEISEEVTAVIYATHHRFRYYGANYLLAMYDKKGNLMEYSPVKKNKQDAFMEGPPSSFLLAYQTYEDTQTAILGVDGQLTTREFYNKWKKDVREYGVDNDNKIVGYEQLACKTYQIHSNGKVEEVDGIVSKDARASLK